MTISKLKAVEPKTAEPQKPKILIYGKAGVGKTFAALDFPSTYYIDTEGGATLSHYTDKLKNSGGVYMGIEQGSMDFETVIGQVKALGTEKHEFKTLVIDSITKLFNAFISDEMERLGDKDQFGASKKAPVAAMKRLINWLMRIDMNVILIAHEKSEWGLNSNKERVEIGTTFDCWDKLEYELDLCLNILKNGGKRVARIRKTRLKGFEDGSVFDWSYDSFAEKYGKDVIEKKSESIVLATPEQLQKIKNLFDTVKMPENTEDKLLKKAGVEGWDEMSTERIENAINYITKTYKEKGE